MMCVPPGNNMNYLSSKVFYIQNKGPWHFHFGQSKFEIKKNRNKIET